MAPLRARSPRVLVVEDQDDVRLMLVTVLQMEGYKVEEASNAHEGLTRLRSHRYDLVLTDYAMPGGTGVSMLRSARTRGFLNQTPAVVVTAHPELARADDPQFTVVGKPIDLDLFLDQVRSTLLTRRRVPASRRAGEHVELVLYVSKDSPASARAERTMRLILGGYEAGSVSFSTCDKEKNPGSASRDGVIFTPTLVKRRPPPKFWIAGDLGDGTPVVDMLRLAGLRPSKELS